MKPGCTPAVAQSDHQQRCAQLLHLRLKFPNPVMRIAEKLLQQAHFFRGVLLGIHH